MHTEIKETYVQSRVRTDLRISTTEHQIEAERNPCMSETVASLLLHHASSHTYYHTSSVCGTIKIVKLADQVESMVQI